MRLKNTIAAPTMSDITMSLRSTVAGRSAEEAAEFILGHGGLDPG